MTTGGLPARPVRGWVSWYHFGPFITRDDVVEHSRLLADGAFAQLGYRLVQLDDGWQQAYGEWTPNTKFPGGLGSLAGEVERRGQCLGIWTAPFLVSASADLAQEAPADWFVTDDSTGERLVEERHRVFGPMFALDASRPPVQDYLRDLYAGMYEAGVRFFKADFLYAGAYAGSRALAAGLKAIKEGTRDAYLLASGAPLLPIVGLAHGCRIGPDTATPLMDFEAWKPSPTVFADEVLDIGRNLAARHFLNGWFQLDADVALVGGNLTLEQARQLVTLAALAGGPFLAGDDLPRLPPERLELLTNPEVLALAGNGAAVPDWEPDTRDLPPTHWRRHDVLALFNWTAEDFELEVRAPGARAARDLWARASLPGFRDGSRLRIPANGVRLLRLDSG
jgi:alpha-galactosidase